MRRDDSRSLFTSWDRAVAITGERLNIGSSTGPRR